MSHGLDSEIRDLAYRLWQEAGHPEGRDLDFWLEAEIRFAARPTAPAPASAPEPVQPVKPRATKPRVTARPNTEGPETRKAPSRSRAKTTK